MRLFVSRRSAAMFALVIGLLFMFFGMAFLFGSLEEISRASVLVSFVFIFASIGCAAMAVKLNKRSLYLFFSTFFLLVGFFLFLSAMNILPFEFSRWWPVFSVFAGIALVTSGWHRYGNLRRQYLVPAVAFIVLGVVLLVFSLDLVSFSLFQFVAVWWPILLVLAGLTLILIALGTKNSGETKQ